MPRGPAPNKKKRRANAPTIPTTELDASGRKGRPPKVPRAYNFRKPATEWWKWAWSTPQALAWDPGALYTIAHRASLEDDLDALDNFEPLELATLLGMEENEALRELGYLVGRLQALAGKRVAVLKEMRELDKVLGLTPAALIANRWEIVDPKAKGGDQKDSSKPAKESEDRKARLKLVS